MRLPSHEKNCSKGFADSEGAFIQQFQPNLRLILTSGELTPEPASSETARLLTVLRTPLSSDYFISRLHTLDKARHVFGVLFDLGVTACTYECEARWVLWVEGLCVCRPNGHLPLESWANLTIPNDSVCRCRFN